MRFIDRIYWFFWFRFLRYIFKGYFVKKQERLLSKLKSEDEIVVIFFAMSLPMWRYQNLYEAMKKHPLFRPYIVLSPRITYSKEQQERDMQKLRNYFTHLGIPFVDFNVGGKVNNIRKTLKPDILFYPQPYDRAFVPLHDSSFFYDKLLAYYPYAFWSASGKWSYDTFFHNIAWKLFYSTEFHKTEAATIASNKGANVAVTGYPNADSFLYSPHLDVWKPQAHKVKRIVWAPHFTISKERSIVTHSNFLWMAHFMLEVAKRYYGKIQIAFKPHPSLLTELYLHPDWGKEKTDAYYSEWDRMENGQLDEGDFKNLFMTSDAIIHDCGSFSIEYHYSLKPAMYVSQNLKAYTDTLSEFGRRAVNLHYIATCEEDICRFIEHQVLDGDDPMLPERQEFYDKYLLPPNDKSVVENTIADILHSLGRK